MNTLQRTAICLIAGGCCLLTVVFGLLSLPSPGAAQQEKEKPAAKRFRYSNTPDEFLPYRHLTPHKDTFATRRTFLGTGREKPPPAGLRTVRIGFIGPLEEEDYPILPPGFRPGVEKNDPTIRFGRDMVGGATLAIEEANRAGGYKGIPFEMIKRTDLVLWGQTSNELVHFAYEDSVWAVLSGIDGNHNHVLIRAALKAELLILNAGNPDPTFVETAIPWVVHVINDDRQNAYVLADYIYRVKGFTRVALLRINNREGRVGVKEFIECAKRLGHPVLMEKRFENGDTDFGDQLRSIQGVSPQAVVLWANPKEAGLIVRQMRKLGMKQDIFGYDRMSHPLFLQEAGEAAEGVVAASPYNPDRDDPEWQRFRRNYKTRFNKEPDAYAAHSYDGMNLLIQCIRKAGLNRVLIRDALYALDTYSGVTGEMIFDTVMNDISPPWLARVQNNRFHYFSSDHPHFVQKLSSTGPVAYPPR